MQLLQRWRSDFALAYVLAHEVGHHVQNQLGIIKQTSELRKKLSVTDYNRVSVAQELKADYFAGPFAYYLKEKGYREAGDIEEAMNVASTIGDDRIQEMARRNVDVDSFTHGSSEQRKEAFELGFKYHDINHSMKFFDDL
ncbi:neutral zinc metallopeptidase [Anaerococcus tetradius]|uniref:neutral zinc metallopeptidase n=1 Tax=Anaerococcus tetradius TaxID=33036 RepID=UPI003C6C6CEB